MKLLKNHTWKVIGLIAVLAIGGSVMYSNKVAKEANEGISFSAHIKGAENPTVTLTEYSDFECPACAQMYPVLKEVVETYPDQVALEYKHFPLTNIHRHALPAAKAAEAAGQQGKFFEMHDMLFDQQGVWAKSAAPSAYFEQYAQELGLDVALFKRHMKASLIQEKVEGEFAEARTLGFTGTPSLLLNGQPMEYASYAEFIQLIEAAIGVSSSTEAAPVASDVSDVRFGL